MAFVTRTWASAAGWSKDQVQKFVDMMRQARRKPKGKPALVRAWDNGRSALCWYTAHAGAEERKLRDRCRRLFGAKEQELA